MIYTTDTPYLLSALPKNPSNLVYPITRLSRGSIIYPGSYLGGLLEPHPFILPTLSSSLLALTCLLAHAQYVAGFLVLARSYSILGFSQISPPLPDLVYNIYPSRRRWPQLPLKRSFSYTSGG